MARGALTVVEAGEPLHRLPVAAALEIHRERDGAAAGLLRPLHESAGRFPVVLGVELIPDRRASGLEHVLDSGRSDRRKNLKMIPLASAAGDGDFSVGMKRPLSSRRGEHDGSRPPGAQDLGLGIDLAHVDEPARPELEPREPVAVRPDGPVVVGARREVAPVRGIQVLLSEDLEVEDVDRFLG